MQPEILNPRRRQLLVGAALGLAARLVLVGQAQAQDTGGSATFVPLKQTEAGLLNIGYAEAGRQDGPAVLLLHGWPYDIHSYTDVAPLLAAAGYRVIIPYLRGYGTTRFLSQETVRNGQQSAFAVDMITLLDALGIQWAVIACYCARSQAAHRDSR